MTGTLINIFAVLAGGGLGLLFGSRLSDSLKKTVIAGLGLFTAVTGIQMFLKTNNSLIVLGAILIGVLLGEWWKIEDGLQNLGKWLEKRLGHSPGGIVLQSGESRFVRGFLTASLLFCVGPMAILGSIQDGLTGDYNTLAIKSVLDCFASLAFASTLGVGVLFSVLVILVYQGGISLLAAQLNSVVTSPMLAEMTAAGGVILLAIAVSSLLELKPVRVSNFLPALIIAPLIVAILAHFGIK
jgi:uncharacterized membrane protein YqgA involved in biofilm formation